MAGLNQNHKRRILTSLQYADKLLQESLNALSPAARPLFPGFVQDLTAEKARRLESYAARIREQMARLLEKCGIDHHSPSAAASGKIRTCLTSLDLTLEDLYPEKLRGYGKMDVAAARELSQALQEIRGLVGQLLEVLSEPAPKRDPGSTL